MENFLSRYGNTYQHFDHFLIQLLSLSLLSRILRGFKQVDRQLVPFLTVRLVTSFKKREFVPKKEILSADNCNDTLTSKGAWVANTAGQLLS